MTTEKKGCLAFAVCGSFCTLEDALGAAQALTAQGWTLLPVMSFAAQQDTRFGTGESWRKRLQAVTGQPVLDTLQAVEPLGPRRLAQALVVAPCTGATLARLAAAVLSTEKGRKTVGWVIAAILSPLILLAAFLCSFGTAAVEHNNFAVSASF